MVAVIKHKSFNIFDGLNNYHYQERKYWTYTETINFSSQLLMWLHRNLANYFHIEIENAQILIRAWKIKSCSNHCNFNFCLMTLKCIQLVQNSLKRYKSMTNWWTIYLYNISFDFLRALLFSFSITKQENSLYN